MEGDPDQLRDIYWKFFQENAVQARHHETQRSVVATALIAIAGATVGFMTMDRGLTIIDIPLTVLMIAVGVFGVLLSEAVRTLRASHNARPPVS